MAGAHAWGKPAQRPNASGFSQPGRLENLCFRYGFDSSQARQIVRWGRFQGLLFAPEKRAEHAFGRRVERSAGGWCGKPGACLAADGPLAPQTGASFGQPTGPNRQAPNRPSRCNQAPPRPAFAAAHTSQAFADFATGLIAAKPEKPCDRGVSGAFYLLLKREQNTPAGRL